MRNLEVAQVFKNIAEILEIKQDNPFRIRAYQRAAQNLEGLTEDIEVLAKVDKLESIPGIGKDLAEKIKEILKTGSLKQYEDLKKEVPKGLVELLSVPGIGPKTAKLLYEELKIKDIQDLERQARAGKLRTLPGLREKTEENILRGIELIKKGRERMGLAKALSVADEFIFALKKLREVKKISPAGSLRRMKETVRDIDILVTSPHPVRNTKYSQRNKISNGTRPQKVMDVFTSLPQVKEILAKGSTKSSVLTKDGIQVDVRVVEPESFGAALLYFTGSKADNIKMREMAMKKGWKINEYGVFRAKTRLAGQTEEEIFKLLGLPYIAPELREDAGEIEAGLAGGLPKLIELLDIKGDLHIHSKWSDGGNSISEVAEATRRKGYKYIAICDHSQSLKVAGGLSKQELTRQMAEIRALNKKLKDFRTLSGTEVDIDSEGNLDYKDELLKELDIVVAAIHTGFKQSKSVLTKRVVRACQNKNVDIIAHPTGRLMGVRDAYTIDLDEVMKVAKETGTFLEINTYPQRLDLNDIHCRKAKEMDVELAIGTDAHTLSQLDTILLGVSVARRGWLEKKDVVNTLSCKELLKRLKR
jgi:DNA polymerase (family 10)